MTEALSLMENLPFPPTDLCQGSESVLIKKPVEFFFSKGPQGPDMLLCNRLKRRLGRRGEWWSRLRVGIRCLGSDTISR